MSAFSDQIVTLDYTGLRCPLPILRFRKALQAVVPGQQLALLSDDPNTRRDFPDFCSASGHTLLNVTEEAKGWRFLVQAGCAAETSDE